MKMAAFLLLLTFNAHAGTLYLHCDNSVGPSACGLRAEAALEKLGCYIDPAATNCTYSLAEDPKHPGKTINTDKPYCEIISSNCSQPHLGNFGGESCFSGEKVSLAKSDRVHNGYWFGFFGDYSRTICITR